MKLTLTTIGRFMTLLVLYSTSFLGHVYAQATVCPIGVSTEPKARSVSRSTNHVSEVYSPYFTQWHNLQNVKFSDDVKAAITLSDISRSRQITGNQFGFNLPEGATINGITLMIEGRSSMYKNIDEVEIFLLDKNGEIKGENKKNTAKLQHAWSQGRDGRDAVWMYGNAIDTWGASWTTEDINSPNFGFQLQIRTITEDSIDIEIDQIQIIVDYTPPYSFCDGSSLTFYIDKYELFGSYVWDFPEGFKIVSASPYYQTIDLDITTTQYGLYEICVDVYNKDGSFAGTCCRNILYRDCQSSSITGRVWADLNNNHIQDSDDDDLPQVQLKLYTENGILVDSVWSDSVGQYAFSKLSAGKYYIIADTLKNKLFITKTGKNPEVDSDIKHTFVLGSTALITLDIGENIEHIDFGYTPLVSVKGIVWEDDNFDGLIGQSEKGIKNIRVDLFSKNGQLFKSTITDANGQYVFDSIPAASYYVHVDIPQDYYATFLNPINNNASSKINTDGKTGLYPLAYDNIEHIHGGLYRKISIGDFVWEDINGNGIQDIGEPGVEGITVLLNGVEGDGSHVARQTTTDIDGHYTFESLNPGNYSLSFGNTTGYLFTKANIGDDEFDSDVVDGVISDIHLISGQNIKTYDAGIYRPGSIGDFVWHDLNADGVQDLGEPGIVGVVLQLFKEENGIKTMIAMTTTDENGHYLFEGLTPETYEISIEAAQDYHFSKPKATSDDKDSDVVNGFISDIIISSNQHITDKDAALYKYGTIGDFVWEDINGNGIQDIGEPGIEGINITLSGTTGDGSLVSLATSTDLNGKYSFSNLIPGHYLVYLKLPAGHVMTIAQQGNDHTIDSDSDNGIVDNTVLLSDDFRNDIDFGLLRYSTIINKVWHDLNANGIQDVGEPPLQGIEVSLTGTTSKGSSFSKSTTTDAAGQYTFTELLPGNYTLQIIIPSDMFVTEKHQGNDPTKDSDFDNAGSASISIISGQMVTSVDAGLYQKGSIGDFVWHDLNADGIQDINELGIEGIPVHLNGHTGTGIAVTTSTTTDNRGIYHFNNLIPGQYQVSIHPDSTYTFSPAYVGVDTDKDSDGINGVSDLVDILSGVLKNDVDFGLIKAVTIGDFVWHDLNANGIQESGEPGISNIELTLSGVHPDGTPLLLSTVTDQDGHYQFTNVFPGDYTITLNRPTDFIATRLKANNAPDKDSDLPSNSNQWSIHVANQDLTQDAGLVQTGGLGGFVWEDMNANGIFDNGEPPLPNIRVLLDGTDLYGRSVSLDAFTGADGRYAFSGLHPGNYQINFELLAAYEFSKSINNLASLTSGTVISNIDAPVFRRAALGDFVWNDANGNGIQDSNEKGIEGIQITLTGKTPHGSVNTTTVTDEDGKYNFKKLVPGQYKLQFVEPSGFVPTVKNAGNQATDSDININGSTDEFTLVSNDNNIDMDAGFVTQANASIGQMVWEDLNADGIRNINEPAIEGIRLSLTGTTLSGDPIQATTISDAQGKYSFNNLQAGNYTIEVHTGSTYQITALHKGSSDVDSDAHPTTGRTDLIHLGFNDHLSNIDFGLYKFASVGDFVWHDINADGIQNNTEPGIKGVSLTLSGTTGDGRKIQLTEVTDDNGIFNFGQIVPGDYNLSVLTPANHEITLAHQGNDDTKDSDFAKGSPVTVKLSSGEHISHLDAGLVKFSGIGDLVWEDVNGNGIQDDDEPGISGISISLTGIDMFGTNVNVQNITNAQGSYNFGPLLPGTYDITFNIPDTYTTSPALQGTNPEKDSDVIGNSINDILLQSDDLRVDLDCGLYKWAGIRGLAWEDTNHNGIRESAEPRLKDVEVTLYKIEQSIPILISSTLTDNTGAYLFEKLSIGTYEVQFKNPDSYEFTIPLVGSPDTDSDVNADGRAKDIILYPNVLIDHMDAGMFIASMQHIGDLVWEDINANGIQDAGEPGIAGITVRLSGTSNSGIPVQQSVMTAADGTYSFKDILPGNYQITVEAPAGFRFTASNQGSDSALDSDGVDGVVTDFIYNGGDVNDLDFGLFKSSIVTGKIWHDLNANGIQDSLELGLKDILISLNGKTGSNDDINRTVTTDSLGYYQLLNLSPGNYTIQISRPAQSSMTSQKKGTDPTRDSDYDLTGKIQIQISSGDTINHTDGGIYYKGLIGDFVWHDKNANGIQDAGEDGVSSVTLRLNGITNAGDTIQQLSVRTNRDGFYTFNNIIPGHYSISIVVPIGYNLTQAHQGSNDSDSDFIKGSTVQISLNSRDTIQNIDAGLVRPGSLGDFVWIDTNENGIQDNGEPGLDGVMVFLTGTDVVGNSVFKQTTSNNSGFYRFPQVDPGSYQLEFEIPDDYIATTPLQGGDPAKDSDVIGNLIQNINISSNDHHDHYDCGLILSHSINGLVWEDKNMDKIQNPGEAFIEGLTVDLFEIKGQHISWIGSTLTAKNGQYIFDRLKAGQYEVMFEHPDGFEMKIVDQKSEQASLSTIPNMAKVTLLSGDIQTNINARIFKNPGLNLGQSIIQVAPAQTAVRLYPNPTLFYMNIQLPDNYTSATYYIVNSVGEVILNGELKDKTTEIKTEDLINGKYSIYIIKDDKLWIKPFVKITN